MRDRLSVFFKWEETQHRVTSKHQGFREFGASVVTRSKEAFLIRSPLALSPLIQVVEVGGVRGRAGERERGDPRGEMPEPHDRALLLSVPSTPAAHLGGGCHSLRTQFMFLCVVGKGHCSPRAATSAKGRRRSVADLSKREWADERKCGSLPYSYTRPYLRLG